MFGFRCVGPWLHNWSRPFWDKEKRQNYSCCLDCGRQEVAPQQYTYHCANEFCPVGCSDSECRNQMRKECRR